MKKILNNPWFVALLVIGAVALVATSLRDQLGHARPSATRSAARVAPDAAAEDESEPGAVETHGSALTIPAALAALVFPATIPDPFSRRGATLVAGDPESPVAGPTAPDVADSVHVSAIWEQDGTSLALVNDRIMRVGEVIGRFTVDEVHLDGLWVSHWKGRNFVAFGGDFTLFTPAAGAVASTRSP